MLIAVISDTHRNSNYIDIARKYIKDVDILIHLGDNADDILSLKEKFKGKVYVVKGNCDFGNKYPKEELIEALDKKIFITHGDMYDVKCGIQKLYYKAKELEADIALFGHTHMEIITEEDNVLFMNPGSISFPKGKGRYIGYIKIEEGSKPDIHLKEIKK